MAKKAKGDTAEANIVEALIVCLHCFCVTLVKGSCPWPALCCRVCKRRLKVDGMSRGKGK